PELLETFAIEGSVVTIDTIGCQKEIAETICEKEADYVFGLKGNQSALLEEVQDEFLFSKAKTAHQDVDFGHGRIETRKCSVIQLKDFDHVVSHQSWANLSSIIKIESKQVLHLVVSCRSTKAITYYTQPLGDRKQTPLDVRCRIFRRLQQETF